MNASNLKTTWNDYYAATSGDTVLKDRNFFRMELDAIGSAMREAVARFGTRTFRVVELGSGSGALARFLLDLLTEEQRSRIHYTGVDFSETAVAKAVEQGVERAHFVCSDFQSYLDACEPVDLIIAQRSIMAVIDEKEQRRLLVTIADRLASGGIAILSEGVAQAQHRIDAMRERLGIGQMKPIWHCRYLDENDIKVSFPSATMTDFASQYWLITRVIYPSLTEPQHNMPLHDLASELPQTGDFGLVKLIVAQKAA